MKNLILETMKYCFTGYNQFLICETKTQAKSYLKQNSSINRIKDLKVITDEMKKEILDTFDNFFHAVYDITSGYAVALEKERKMKLTEIPKESEIHPTPLPYEKENCPNCLDQASIAAPGQTTLCKTHQMRKPLIEVLADQNKVWTSHIEHTHCENCHNQPYQILYISSNFTPLHLCLQCGIKFDSLLNA